MQAGDSLHVSGYNQQDSGCVRWSEQLPLWLPCAITKIKPHSFQHDCNQGNHSVVKTTNLLLQGTDNRCNGKALYWLYFRKHVCTVQCSSVYHADHVFGHWTLQWKKLAQWTNTYCELHLNSTQGSWKYLYSISGQHRSICVEWCHNMQKRQSIKLFVYFLICSFKSSPTVP